MPVRSYGVLKGSPIAAKLAGSKPHYQIHVLAAGVHHRIAVNVKSAESPSDLMYVLDADFHHPVLDGLSPLAPGFTAVPSQAGGLALDFVRGNLFDPADMRVIPTEQAGPDNDLHDLLDLYLQRAVAHGGSEVYAFGSKWGPEPGQPDAYFGFEPGNGIHDVHMNQGNSPGFAQDDGVFQDGALLLRDPAAGRWVAVFLAFQSQAFHTDDTTGHALTTPEVPSEMVAPPLSIVAALVNPPGDDVGLETVTLLNASPDPLELAGWELADHLGRSQGLSGRLEAGETLRVRLEARGVQLSNKGGTITLLDPGGLKAQGVSYTKAEVRRQGWTLAF